MDNTINDYLEVIKFQFNQIGYNKNNEIEEIKKLSKKILDKAIELNNYPGLETYENIAAGKVIDLDFQMNIWIQINACKSRLENICQKAKKLKDSVEQYQNFQLEHTEKLFNDLYEEFSKADSFYKSLDKPQHNDPCRIDIIPRKVFVVFSKEDSQILKFKNTLGLLKDHLDLFKKDIDYYDDNLKFIESDIVRAKNAKIVILLIGSKFLLDGAIAESIMPVILENHDKNLTELLPSIVTFCLYWCKTYHFPKKGTQTSIKISDLKLKNPWNENKSRYIALEKILPAQRREIITELAEECAKRLEKF